jgi:eukaryotic-like serine/threonine-protein kinase
VKDLRLETETLVKRGASIGRYVVLGWLGRGAMGEVYGAYDPELDRKLAIKLLRVKRGSSEGGSDGKSRLLREAQAIAKLSHPNVVVVHDVGSHEDRVFIAMEFIDGGTLGFWLHAKPRPWRDILRTFVAAGRGLQHAHEAGLVHRDFKPENVMVREDGEVRVMDFGLVRHVDILEPEATAPGAAAESAANPALDATIELSRPTRGGDLGPGAQALQAKLTQTGAMMGTPAYMAPEQFVGQAADARTDQFSFCVALYEALYGERPFSGSTMAELSGNVLVGTVKPPPARSRVPLAVWRAVRRGLSVTPDERHPTMNALLADLGRYLHPLRKNVLIAAGAAAAVVVALVGGLAWRELHRQALCRAPAERFAGVWETSGWSASRRTAIEKAFRATGKAYAPATFAGVAHLLDRYVADWSATYSNACEATNVRGDQSAEVLDLRMACLTDRFDELRALSDILAAPTGQIVENAGQAAASLGALERCGNVKLLRGALPPPASREATRQIEGLRAELARARALEDAGKSAEAIAALTDIVTRARTTGYRPLIAEALHALGAAHVANGDAHGAETFLTQAVLEAQAGHHDELLAEATSALIFVRGYAEHDLAGATLWRQLTDASLERIGGNDRLRARALGNWAAALRAARRFDESLAIDEEALGNAQRALGPTHLEVGLVLNQISSTYASLGQYSEALAYSDRALSIAEATVGRDHPRVGAVLANRAEIMAALGRYYEAKENAERTEQLWIKNYGSADHPLLAFPMAMIGIAELGLGHPQRAVSPLTRALALAEANDVAIPLADTRFALARSLWSTRRDRPGAIALAKRVRTDVSALDRPTPRDRALALAVEQWLARTAIADDAAGSRQASPTP